MPAERQVLAQAIGLALLSAFFWATYYPLVLGATPKTAPSAVLAYPFVVGGIVYSGWAIAQGHSRAFLRLWADPMAWVRVALLFGMMVAVLAATYLTGPVDASLLSLIGDVVLTPAIVALFLATYRARIATPLFALGIVVSLAGGTMAIVGGQSLSAVEGWGWLVVPGVPVFVASYFILSARANRTTPASAVVGQSTLAAAFLILLAAPAFPGGWPGLVAVAPLPVVLLAVCGITSFFLAPVLYFRAIQTVGLAVPPMLMTAIPVFTLLLSAGLLGIALPLVGVLGIPVAVAGGLLALRGESSTEPEPAPEPLRPPG
ncbi:MAG TPA: DMT family transporter [Thermoplasmata archaeon]|nr:DMT family transporter [Thermoplasmata archaeon]